MSLGGWALLKSNVSCPGTCYCMLSLVGLCNGEGPICPKCRSISMETLASMLNGLPDRLRLRLRRGGTSWSDPFIIEVKGEGPDRVLKEVSASRSELAWQASCERTKGHAHVTLRVCARASNLSVIDPSIGEVDHGDCARMEGCLRRRVAYILWRVDEVLMGWWTLSRHEQEAEKDSSGTQADSMDCSSKPGWKMAWRFSTMHGFGTIGTVLSKDGGSRLKGMNSLKSGGVFQGLRDNQIARYTPTRNPYLTCAPIIGRRTRLIGS
ncbi:hypothetical protein CRG98_014310 [Punica granatum]|uniref:Uncharacterized protein n=1 Tax=Punica granatum TaxID=22663 RepID=A0A2I0K9P7_PUNGR|nr:hypothetical protein CRG98_014310 [Punica granatum]